MEKARVALLLLLASCCLIPDVTTTWVSTLSEVLTSGVVESTPIDTLLGFLLFNSPRGNAVVYSSNRPQFRVEPQTGAVRLTEPLVFRTMNKMLVTFSATEGSNPAWLTFVELNILPVNHPPFFDSPSYSFSLRDSVAVGSELYSQINVIDHDGGVNGTVDVMCVSGAQICNFFSISASPVAGFSDRKKLTVTLKSPINPNIQPKAFQIRATDRGSPPFTSTADVSFIVENSFDNRPVFLGSPFILQIPENTFDANQDLLNVEMRDSREANSAYHMKLSILGDINDAFMAGAVTSSSAGVYNVPIRLKKALNLAQNNFNTRYTFKLRATQTLNGLDTQSYSETLVSVNILDVNDITPSFEFNEYTAEVTEGLANGAAVPGLLMVVSDQDSGDNGRYDISVQPQAPLPQGVFGVSPSTGQGSTAVGLVLNIPSYIQYDSDPGKNVYRLIVTVKETNTPERRSSTARITLQVTPPTNNRPPFFANNINPIILSDTTPVDSPISTFIKAEDSDSGMNGKLTYTITNEANSQTYFKIDATSGLLSLKSKLDAAVTPSFSFDAIATDGGGLTASTSIRIDVFDTEGPVFKPSFYNVNVTELTTNFIPKLRVKAELGSMVSDRVVEYRLVEGGDFKVSDYFKVDKQGLVTLTKPVDFNDTPDNNGLFEFQVEASVVNYKDIPKNRATIRVYVIDTNNNAPRFLPNSIYRVTIPETTAPDFPVVRVTAIDDDRGTNAEVTYLLLDGARNDFLVDRNGWVKTTPNANLQPDRSYNMKVLAIDGGQPPLSATATVVVNVTDVVKDTPTFNTDEFVFVIREDAAINSLIGSVEARTTEVRAILRYSFVQDSWKAYDPNKQAVPNVPVWNWFSLEPMKAELRVKGALSYQQVSRATVNVSAQVTNMEVATNPSTAYVLVTINIYPVDSTRDQVVFSPFQDSFYIQVPEKQPINTEVFKFDAFEIRTNTPIKNYKLTRLDPSRQSTFFLEKETGILKVIREIVYVKITNKNYTYDLEAIANPSSSAFAKARVVINILPLSADPVFDQDEYTFFIKNPSPRLTFVGVAKASTPFPDQGKVIYSLVNPSNLFQIDSNKGNISLQRALTSQQLQYNLFVKATSTNATHTFSSNVLVNIRVIVDKTLKPYFDNTPYRFLVPLTSSGPVGRVVAYDPNPYNPSQILYSIYNSTTDSSFFSINRDTGIIEATRPLNVNATLVVVATASDNSSFSNHTSVTIQTFLPSSQTPTFLYPNFTNVDAQGNDPASFSLQVVGNPSVVGSVVTYSIDNSTSEVFRLFKIDRNTGVLTFRPGATIPSGFNSYQLFLKVDDGFSNQFKRLNVDVYGNSSPSFLCLDSRIILTANQTPGELSPALNIPSPSLCSDNHPNTQYYFRIIKINDVNYENSDLRDWFVLINKNNSAVSVNTTKHLFFRDNLKNKLTFAVGNSQRDLEQAISDQRTSSFLQSTIQVNPYFSDGPNFASSLKECPGSGNSAVAGILDLTPLNTPVFKMVAGDCDIDPARPNKYSIDKVSYTGPAEPYDGEPTSWDNNNRQPFVINQQTGLVITNIGDYSTYYRGFFDLVVKSTSPFGKLDEATLRVYILREFQKLKMTFDTPVLAATNNNPPFLSNLNKGLEASSLRVVADQVSTLVMADGSRNKAKSSQCYFLVDTQTNVVDYNQQSINNLNNTIFRNNSNNVQSVDDECYVRVGSTHEWSGRRVFWWVLIAFSILVFVVALILACCVCFFWPMNVREMAKARPYIVLDEPQMSMAGSVFDYK